MSSMDVTRGATDNGREVTIPTFDPNWPPLKKLEDYAGLVTFDINVRVDITQDQYGYGVTIGPETDCDTSLMLDYEAAYYLIRGVGLGGYQAVVPRG
jgi:hypothetical protein